MPPARRRTCLGTRVLTLGNNKKHDGDLLKLGTSDGSGNASILVECIDDNHCNQAVEINLWTGTRSLGCTVALSDVSVLFHKNNKENHNQESEGEASSRILALGRLFLLDDKSPEQKDSTLSPPPQDGMFRDLAITFQYETNRGGNDNTINNQNLCVALQQNVGNGMKRTILKKNLEPFDESSERSYHRSVGNALNRTLQEAEALKSGRGHWKKTAEDLGRIQQETKDTLLANFVKLRNFMVQKHQAELEELGRAHEKEKESLAASAAAASSHKAPKIKKEPEPVINDTKDLPAVADALALAEGRKWEASQNKYNKTRSLKRTAYLKAEDAVDMVQIRREAEAFQRSKERKRKRKQQQQNRSNEEDSSKQNHLTKPRETSRPAVVKSSRVADDDDGDNDGDEDDGGDFVLERSSKFARKDPPRDTTVFRAKQNLVIRDEPTKRDALAASPATPSKSVASLSTRPPDDTGSTSSESSWVLR